MSYNEKNIRSNYDDDDDTDGTGGQGSSIAYHDFVTAGSQSRDDLLSATDKKHLLMAHANQHEFRVKQQKELREQRKALKEGKISNEAYKQNMEGAGYTSQYKVNPVLANKAQFSGIDKQTNQLPNENVAETNNEDRHELENEYKKKYAPEMQPKFHPKPSPHN